MFAYSLVCNLVRIYDMTSINLLSAWLVFANIDWERKACILLAKYRETNAFTLCIGSNSWKRVSFPSFFKRHPLVIKSLEMTGQLPKMLRTAWPLSSYLQSIGAGFHPSVSCQYNPAAISWTSKHSKVKCGCLFRTFQIQSPSLKTKNNNQINKKVMCLIVCVSIVWILHGANSIYFC